mgnify:CR=1 FL=1
MKKNTVKVFLLLALGLGGLKATAQTPEQVERIRAQYNIEESEALSLQLADKAKIEKVEALRLAEINGWPVTQTFEDGRFIELMRVNDGKPVYYTTYNHGSATLMNVDDINTGGSAGLSLDGQDMTAGEWDGGAVRRFHQDLTGRVTQKDNATTISDHATHVAGTIMGSGVGNANAKGMASQAKLWANDWNGDTGEMTTQAAQGLLVSNHSYGRNVEDVSTAEFGQYNSESNIWDNITFNHKYYQPVVAAGNDRNAQPAANPSKNGRDLLFDQAVSKNVVVVGAIDQAMAMSSFSNWGPTDDKRIKPDIVAKGVNVTSTWGTANNAYMAENGTSMASPGITGSLLLLQQHFDNENGDEGDFMRSATLRGLMAHTARDLGDLGPDHIYGWGLLNAQAAAAVITNNGGSSLVSELSLANNATYSLNVTASGTEPLVVTIAWTDRPHAAISGLDNVTPALVNDLDVKISRGGVDYFPWRLNTGLLSAGAQHADNTVDNIEKIQLYNPANISNSSPTFTPQAGDVYTITVKHKGTLFGSTAQEYSLIVSGITGSTASIDDNAFAASFNMWPNPAQDILNISMLEGNDVNVVIYDVQGRKVAGKDFTGSSFEKTIDISSLTSGIYMVEFSNGNQKTTKKLLKK